MRVSRATIRRSPAPLGEPRNDESLCDVVHTVGAILLEAGHRTTDAERNAVIAQNLTSAFYVVRAAAPRLAVRGGAIVRFSTAATRIGMANHEAISAARAGVEGLARASAAARDSRSRADRRHVAGLLNAATERFEHRTPSRTYVIAGPRRREGVPPEGGSRCRIIPSGWMLPMGSREIIHPLRARKRLNSRETAAARALLYG